MNRPTALALFGFALAIVSCLFLTWLPLALPLDLPAMVLNPSAAVIEFLRNVIPGLLFGLMAIYRPVLLGAFAGGVAGVVASAWIMSTSPLTLTPAEAMQAFLVHSLYGGVSSGAGAYIRMRANSSFKPNPLRGSA